VASWTDSPPRGVRDFLQGWRRRDAQRPLAVEEWPTQVQAAAAAQEAPTTPHAEPEQAQLWA
jgi:hypothetical protein